MSIRSGTRRARMRLTSRQTNDECEYQGLDRREWVWEGEAGEADKNLNSFVDWRNCQVSTDKFQELTAPGQGTAALRRPEPWEDEQRCKWPNAGGKDCKPPDETEPEPEPEPEPQPQPQPQPQPEPEPQSGLGTVALGSAGLLAVVLAISAA